MTNRVWIGLSFAVSRASRLTSKLLNSCSSSTSAKFTVSHVKHSKLSYSAVTMSVAFEPPLVRSATLEDIAQVRAIYSHYNLHTLPDMRHLPPSLTSYTAEDESLTGLGHRQIAACLVTCISIATPSPQLPLRDEKQKSDMPTEMNVEV